MRISRTSDNIYLFYFQFRVYEVGRQMEILINTMYGMDSPTSANLYVLPITGERVRSDIAGIGLILFLTPFVDEKEFGYT